jgi:GcrA cell cycle regulator
MDAIMPRKDLWTDENKKAARDLWMAGHSARYIGEQMGKTRRSIMGLMNRLGLMRVKRPANPSPWKQQKGNQYVGRQAVIPLFVARKPLKAVMGHKRSDGQAMTIKDVPMPEPSVAAKTSYRTGGKITLMQLRSNSCKWPLGDPVLKPDEFGYCGAATDGIAVYCTIHKKIAYYSR